MSCYVIVVTKVSKLKMCIPCLFSNHKRPIKVNPAILKMPIELIGMKLFSMAVWSTTIGRNGT